MTPMSMNGPGGGWLLGSRGFRMAVVGLVLGVGVVSGLVLTSLQRTEHDRQSAERAAGQVVTSVGVIDGLEWRAIAGEEIEELSEALEVEVSVLQAELLSLGGDEASVELRGASLVYLDAVRDLLRALEVGDEVAAEEIDETRVDPAFEETIELAVAFAETEAAAAMATESTVGKLTWATSMGTVSLLAVALWFLLARNEHRAAARKSAEMDRRFRSLVESSRDVFSVVTGTDQLGVMSDSLGPLAEIARSTTARTVSGVLPDEGFTAWTPADERLRNGAGAQTIEFAARRGDDTTVYIEAQGSSLVGSDDERVWVWRDITERKELELQLAHQAFHDSLTGVANRALLQDRADHALARSARTGNPVSLLFCDLDDFKTVNDSLGHGKGDELLSIVTNRLAGCVRDSDTLARFGGDEFAILLEDADTEMAHALADRILDVVGYEVNLDDRVIFPSISIGVATSIPGATTDELIRNADTAMYAAKRAGKGTTAVFQDGMHDVSTNLLELQSELKVALEDNQLILHYQPTVALSDGQVEGVEALIRWEHPDRGLIHPDTFIPVAEATGTIIAIGKWVLATACETAVQLQDGQAEPLLMHVNLSPQQLRDPRLVAVVKETLASSGLAPELLVLEITEGTLLDDRTAIQRLHELHDLGVLIAIDDFGTGYTSINYLQQLPIDVLKIDRSFVSGHALPPNQRAAFLHAIVGLAKSLHVRSVAEGIEQYDQLDELKQLGCDAGQGFLWSPAVQRTAVESTIDELTHTTTRT